MRKVLGFYSSPPSHWVGDGFPVRSHVLARQPWPACQPVPAARLCRAGRFSAQREAARRRRASASRLRDGHHRLSGRGRAPRFDRQGRPHRPGRRAVDDRGLRHPARGIPLRAFTRKGGTLEMVQLWVNLPAGQECCARLPDASRQGHSCSVTLPDEAGTLRVIAGEYAGKRGPARTFTPINVWDMRLRQGGSDLAHLAGRTHRGRLVLQGTVRVNGGDARARRSSCCSTAAAASSRWKPTAMLRS